MIFIPLLIAIPLGTAFLIPIGAKLWKPFAPLASNLASCALVVGGVYGIGVVQTREIVVYRMGNWPPPLGIVMGFDALSAFFVLTIALVVFAGNLFAVRYMARYAGQWKFYTLYMLVTTGLIGISITGDLFNMFVWIEIAAISSYALVSFGLEAEDLEASLKYMIIGEIAGMLLLLAIALLYARTGTLNLADISRSLAAFKQSTFFWLVLGLLLAAFSIKAALVPFHAWLPDAHPAAPAPVSGLLSGVFIKVLGVYTTCRMVFNVFGLSRQNAPLFFDILIGMGLVSLVFASLTALNQKDYKRLLGYSSVAQVGFIMIGFGIGNYYGVCGAVFYLLAHALGKCLLFLTAGSVFHATGTRDITRLAGLGEKMPTTAWSFRIGAMSMIGLPPFVGFFGKLFITLGAVQSGYVWLAVVTAGFSVLTLAYLLKIENGVFMKQGAAEVREAPFSMRVSMVLLVALVLVLGIGFRPVMDFLVEPAAQALLRGLQYATLIFGG